jgi:NAD+ synthase
MQYYNYCSVNMTIEQQLRKHPDKNAQKIAAFIRRTLFEQFRKKGAVLGVSGGIDSAVALHLLVESIGRERIQALLLPEKESSPESRHLGAEICEQLGVACEEIPITPILEGLNIYDKKVDLIRRYYPEYDPEVHATSLALPRDIMDQSLLNVPYLKLVDDGSVVDEKRLRAKDYLEIIGLQNVKQRSRMIVLYMVAEQMNYAVCGTTNKTEAYCGFYVKYGDGGVDIEPLQDCYKTQVFEMARHLNVDQRIIDRPPSPDTWSHFIGDEEFIWRMPVEVLDQLLYADEHGMTQDAIMESTGLSKDMILKGQKHISSLKRAAEFIAATPPTCRLDE